jgi:hypothetical protein
VLNLPPFVMARIALAMQTGQVVRLFGHERYPIVVMWGTSAARRSPGAEDWHPGPA